MSVHLDADPLLRAVAHQMHDELARQGAQLDPKIIDSAAAAVLGQAYGDTHAGEMVTRLGAQNPQLAAIFGTAFTFLKSHPGFWVGWYALKHHETPLPHDHPWAGHVARAFGESDAHHALHPHHHHHHHPHALPPPAPVPHPAAPVASGWGDYAAGWGGHHHGGHHHHHHEQQQEQPDPDYGTDTGYRPAPPNFGHSYAHGPRPASMYGGGRRPPPPPPRVNPYAQQQQAQQPYYPPQPPQQPYPTDPSQYGQAQPYADPSQYLPAQPPTQPDPTQYGAPPAPPPADPSASPGTSPAFDPATMEGMFTPLPVQPGSPPQGPGAPGAPVDGGSTDVSTAGYTTGLDHHALRRTINGWIATLQSAPVPANVTQQQRAYLIQQLFALALSPTPATFQVVWQQLAQQGPEAVRYLRGLWLLFNPPTYPGAAPQLYPPIVSGWGHPGGNQPLGRGRASWVGRPSGPRRRARSARARGGPAPGVAPRARRGASAPAVAPRRPARALAPGAPAPHVGRSPGGPRARLGLAASARQLHAVASDPPRLVAQRLPWVVAAVRPVRRHDRA